MRWRRVVLACVAVSAALASAGCGADDAPAPTPSAPTTSTAAPTATPTPAPVWPLTGLPADAAPAQPVLVVKIDNTAGARPQVGLSAADLVVEELVEGGSTRLAAMFHAALPPQVGPVRSIRTTDIGIVGPTQGVLAASGGAGRVLKQLADAGQQVRTESDAGFSRDGDRRAPYNVMLDPSELVATLAGAPAPAQPYLPWGEAPQGAPASTAEVTFSGGHTTSWSWSGTTWSRADSLAAEGEDFPAASVLILRVTTRDAGYEDPAGNPVPETVLEGSGEAIVLTGGQQIPATWTKGGAAEPITLADAQGVALSVPPGRTWIELVPEAGSVMVR